jgi:hypothetical protein
MDKYNKLHKMNEEHKTTLTNNLNMLIYAHAISPNDVILNTLNILSDIEKNNETNFIHNFYNIYKESLNN